MRKPYFEPFCLFSEILCLFLQFSTLESCYIWFKISLEYPSAYVYSGCPAKFKIGVGQGVCKPFFEPFCVFSETLCLFLLFSTLVSCYIWLVTSLEYPSAYVYSGCPGKFKIGVGQGVRKPYFEPFLPIFLDFLSFSPVFHVGILLYLVYN